MHNKKRLPLSHFLIVTAALFAVWILLSGRFELKFILIGLASSLIISIICYPFFIVKNIKTGKEFFVFKLNPIKLLVYGLWLLKEIFKSSIDVAKDVIQFKKEREPRIVYFSMPYENPIAHVFLANSIILTPGTITVDVIDNNIYEIHALNEDFADGVLSGEMQNKIAKLFGETCEFKPMQQLTYIRKGVK